MSDTKIKICGLRRLQDIEYVNEALPDFVGFVFAKSRRQVSPDTAAVLKSSLDKRIKSVGVFVNEDMDLIEALCSKGIIDYIQLHGDETPLYLHKLKERLEKAGCYKPLIKAIRVKDAASLSEVVKLSSTEFLILDAFNENEYGGTGKTFDWELAAGIGKRIFLAGGLNIHNVHSAVNAVRPFCLDVSSGVETDGFKDRNKIIALIKLVRSVK